jgi:hypothetical protein
MHNQWRRWDSTDESLCILWNKHLHLIYLKYIFSRDLCMLCCTYLEAWHCTVLPSPGTCSKLCISACVSVQRIHSTSSAGDTNFAQAHFQRPFYCLITPYWPVLLLPFLESSVDLKVSRSECTGGTRNIKHCVIFGVLTITIWTESEIQIIMGCATGHDW